MFKKTIFILISLVWAIAGLTSELCAQESQAEWEARFRELKRQTEELLAWKDAMHMTDYKKEVDAALKKAKLERFPIPREEDSLSLKNMQRGDIGHLRYWPCEVDQIVDPRNMILSIGPEDDKIKIWFEGANTARLVDGKSIRIRDYVEVVGNRSFTTVTGTEVAQTSWAR